jgi:serine/threonine protein kinase
VEVSLIGQIIGNIYQVLEKLGEGGMGSVYKGIDLNLQRPVAIKVLRADFSNNPALVERFHSEAVTLAKLNHPNIATLFSFIPQNGQFFMIMEFVKGETLENIIRHRGAIPYQEAIMLFSQALEGIALAHKMGIIHRDIKPANLMVTEDEFQETKVKVMDFGIARILGTNRLTRPGGMVGTLHYMSPEQARAQDTDNRSDIYSLGIVLYEMLTGKIPFDANSEYDLIDLHVKQAPTPPRTFNPSIPQEVENAVLKAMSKSPSDRFQTVVEFRSFLLNQIGISVSNIQSAPLIKETRVESLIGNKSVEPIPPQIPSTKVETNPNLGVIPGTRVETNPGLRQATPATIPELKDPKAQNAPFGISEQSKPNAYQLTGPGVPIPEQTKPLPVEKSFLSKHGIKLAASTTILILIVIGVLINNPINSVQKSNSVETASPIPIISPTPQAILNSGPISKETLVFTLLKIPKDSHLQLSKEIVKFKVDFEVTEEIEKDLIIAGASEELIATIKGSYLAPKTSPTPTQTVNTEPTPKESPKIDPFPGGDNTSVKTTITPKPLPPKQTPKPLEVRPIQTPKRLSPLERQIRKQQLQKQMSALLIQSGEVDPKDLKRRNELEKQRRETQKELDELNKLK